MKIKHIDEDFQVQKSKKQKEPELITSVITNAKSQLSAGAFIITTKNMARRYSSEKKLEELIDWELKEGNCYHIISQGDIDSVTYLRHVIKQQTIDSLILSTWCMSTNDILEIESWIKNGRIRYVEFYLGEIFKGTYAGEYLELKRLESEGKCKVVIFRNHSKVMCAHGNKFSFVIESSANVNTNPRCENTVITIDKSLTSFYVDFYRGITSFDK